MDDFELFFTGEKATEILEYFYKDKDKSKIFIWDFEVKKIVEAFIDDHWEKLDGWYDEILNNFSFWKVERQKVVLAIPYSEDAKEVSTQTLKVKECISYVQKELEKEKADGENNQFLESGEYIGDYLEYSVDDFLEKKTLKEKLEEQSGLVLFGSEGLESLEKVREWLGTSKKYFIERLLLIEYIKKLTPDDPEELSYSFLKSLGRS